MYNKTAYSGLETDIEGSYLNPLLQLLKFTTLIRNMALSHVGGSCLYPECLLCELGFLFDMLEKAEGIICQAKNFLKTYNYLHICKISPRYCGYQIRRDLLQFSSKANYRPGIGHQACKSD